MCKLSKYFNTYHLSSACVTNTSHVSNLWHYHLGYISNSRVQLIRDPVVIKKLMLYYQWKSLLCFPHSKTTESFFIIKACTNLFSILNLYIVTYGGYILWLLMMGVDIFLPLSMIYLVVLRFIYSKTSQMHENL